MQNLKLGKEFKKMSSEFKESEYSTKMEKSIFSFKKDISTLKPTTMIDMAAKKDMIVRLKGEDGQWSIGDAQNCDSYPMSISNRKMLTQTADNDIMYDEIEKAEKRLNNASKSLVCLQDHQGVVVQLVVLVQTMHLQDYLYSAFGSMHHLFCH